ncbi:putative neprosin [Medicago truncatula]|uniref:Putative neprosin n=1 Tax=Medicago truncatula TaxID=3880 RepID=A0A396J6X9_MEDTR|nr:uncharacterized protein LOC25486622 isoform X1 [Medicago truncatula]RHN73820.1 putative neprosin [Medicago truncatula]
MDLIILLVLSLCITCCKVEARSKILLDETNNFTLSYSIEDFVADKFDCVDIYKQPALQHPLLKKHKIQLFPTFAKNIVRNRPSYGKTADDCPLGKVPIYNSRGGHQIITNSSSKLQIDDFQRHSKSNPGYHTVTLDTIQNTIFHGAYAGITGYDLSVQAKQYSMSYIWVESGSGTQLNSIKVGVGVFPSLYHDNQLLLTSRWTADGFKQTGCYNDNCPGFVQVNSNKDYSLGIVISPTNSIGPTEKDRSTGHWWLLMDPKSIQVGYWPRELFNHLGMGASKIRFGGQTYAPPNTNSPPMGSGRLPKEKFENSGFMGQLRIIDSQYNEADVKPENMKPYRDTNSNCYDVIYNGFEGRLHRQAFLYGGPGGRNCGI